MSKVIDVPADSSPAAVDTQPEDGWAEFQAEKAANAAKSAPSPREAKDAPDSEPVVNADADATVTAAKPEQSKPLPPEMVERKRANNEKRWNETLRQNADLKAENERLKAGKSAPVGAADSATAKPDAPKLGTATTDDDPEPKEEDYLTVPNGFAKYTRDLAAHATRAVLKADRERAAQEKRESAEADTAKTFQSKLDAYAADHEGFYSTAGEVGALDVVREAIVGKMPAIDDALATHEKSVELVDYLGRNPDELAKITSAGSEIRALLELGKIIASQFDSVADATTDAQVTPKPKKALPNPPARVGGRAIPTGEAILDAMAQKDELPMNWREPFREREKRQR